MVRKKVRKIVAQPKAKTDSRQLVVTLSASNGEIQKIEELGSTEKRRAFSEAEFAALAGDRSRHNACDALEAACMAGVHDGFDDSQFDDLPAGASQEKGDAQNPLGEDVLRAGIRQIIFSGRSVVGWSAARTNRAVTARTTPDRKGFKECEAARLAEHRTVRGATRGKEHHARTFFHGRTR